MKVAELLEKRRQNWHELEQLCDLAQNARRKKVGAAATARMAALYRAACADLALADAYQLPPNTVQYLHRLVGRAHNQLYQSRNFSYSSWGRTLLVDVPQRVFHDRCVQLAFCIFWGIFILSAVMAYSPSMWPGYAETILTESQIEMLETNFSEPIQGRDPNASFAMAGFYIWNNAGIGLQCFAFSLLVVPGLGIVVFNAAFLGAAFGYMARPDVAEGANFFHFVTAHGPFELTAIVLSGGAGLRLGMSWIRTLGLQRSDSLRKTALEEAMPIMGSVIVLFVLAAFIEAFLSPSAAPYWVKALAAVVSSGMLMFYFVVLGFPRRASGAA